MEENKMIKHTKNGWVNLSNLIMRGNIFDWERCIGKTVDFQYEDIVATLTVTGRCNSQYVYIDIPGYVSHHPIYVGQIKNGQLGSCVRMRTPDFKYETGSVVNDLLLLSSYHTKYKYYHYRCLRDGYEGDIREDHLVKNHGCPVCANKVVLAGWNDIATTNPNIAKLFYNKDDALKYTEHSGKLVYFKCPRCGNTIHACIKDVVHRGLSCKKCGDGISYPNKFVYNFVEQLSILYQSKGKQFEFTSEKVFPWSVNFDHENKRLAGKKIYDMFINTHNIVIENHGDYHYVHGFKHIKSARSLEEVQENDTIKKNLAISNGIEETCYVILDCGKSNMEYIKESIMSSNLPTLLGFTEDDVDWHKCDEFATSSRVYEACCYWNDGITDCKKIASLMKMHHATIKRYICKGRELNIIKNTTK